MNMNSKLVNAIVFAVGAAVGSIVTWQFAKYTCDKLIAEERQAIREYYKGRYEETEEGEPEPKTVDVGTSAYLCKREITEEERQDVRKYSDITRSYVSPETEQDVEYCPEPAFICPEDFGDEEGYEVVNLTYYADKILADNNGKIVQDAETIVGDFEEHIGDYEVDAVHIRNDWNQCYYEILAVEDKYHDIYGPNPHQKEVE